MAFPTRKARSSLADLKYNVGNGNEGEVRMNPQLSGEYLHMTANSR